MQKQPPGGGLGNAAVTRAVRGAALPLLTISIYI